MLRLVLKATSLVARVASVNGNFLESRMTYATFRNNKKRDIANPSLNHPSITSKKPKINSDEAKGFHSRYELVLADYVKSAKDLSDLSLQKESMFKQYGNFQFNESSFDAIFMRICLVINE